MTTKCALCSNYSMTDLDRTYIRAGLGRCAHGPVWQFPNPYIERECELFNRVPDTEIPARERVLGPIYRMKN